MKRKKRIIFLSISKLLKEGFRKLVLWKILYVALVALIIIPCSQEVYQFLLRTNGYSYLTPELMISFFRQPGTILACLALLWLIGCLMMYGILFSYVYFNCIQKREKISFWALLYITGKKFLRMFRMKNVGTVSFVWGMFLFENIPLITGVFMRMRMPKYLMDLIWNFKGMKIIILVVILSIFIYAYRNFFVLPYLFLEGSTLKEAKKKSKELLHGRKSKTLFYFLLCNGMTFLCFAGIYIFIIAIEAAIVLLFVPNAIKIVMFWTIYDHMNIYVAIIFGVIGTIANIAIVMSLYYRYKKEKGETYGVSMNDEYLDENKEKIHKRFLLGAFVMIMVVDVVITYDSVKNGYKKVGSGIIKITSHRGASKGAPENTLPAIQKAIDDMADYVEIDVQESKDGVIVLMHDNTLWRTANCKEKVSDLTYQQLKQLDVGEWFSAEYNDTRIPTLEEVLLLCKGKIAVNIELKNRVSNGDFENKVVELIEKYDFEQQCVVTSVHRSSLQKVKQYNNKIKTGYIISAAYGTYYNDTAVDFVSIKSGFVTERLIRHIHNAGKEIHVWTVNSKKEANRMNQLRVDNIITDKPLQMREYIYKKENENDTLIDFISMVIK